MAADLSFARSLQAARADRPTVWSWVLFAVAAVAYGLWLTAARVTVYETSEHSRLEVASAGHSADAPVAGKLARLPLRLQQHVAAGDILAELDSTQQRLQLSERRTQFLARTHQLRAAAAELDALVRAQTAESLEAMAATAAARAETEAARVRARSAAADAARATQMHGAIAEAEVERSVAAARERQEAARASHLLAWRLQRTQGTRRSQMQVRIEALRREQVALEAEQAETQAAMATLENEVALRTLRAPIAGQVVEATTLRPGAYVAAGTRLAVIVASGPVHLIAELPKRALGRVQAGQRARLRLDGFSWLEYGSGYGQVVRIGEQGLTGTIRVEIALGLESSPRIPYQHGLTGTVEIAIEEVSPLTLLLRTTGRFLSQRPST